MKPATPAIRPTAITTSMTQMGQSQQVALYQTLTCCCCAGTCTTAMDLLERNLVDFALLMAVVTCDFVATTADGCGFGSGAAGGELWTGGAGPD